jgi:hypothetical protein
MSQDKDIERSQNPDITIWTENNTQKIKNLYKKGTIEIGSGKTKRKLKVVISSAETDDKKLLHNLLEKTRK